MIWAMGKEHDMAITFLFAFSWEQFIISGSLYILDTDKIYKGRDWSNNRENEVVSNPLGDQ